MKRVLTLAIAACLVSAVATQSRSAADLYQEALHVQDVKGDLPKAIELYRSIVDKPGNDRAIVARALLQLGECYEKLGRSDARRMYERIVREYADSGVVLSSARGRLAAMQSSPEPFKRQTLGAELVSGSPDGRFAVFQNDDINRIFLRELSSRTDRLLADLDGMASNFAWSPDSRELAFNFQNTMAAVREVRIITIATGRSRSLPIRSYPIGWTNTGELYLYQTNYPANAVDMYLTPVAGGAPRKVVSWPVGDGCCPVITPDGKSVVGPKSKRLVRIDLASGAEQPVTLGTAEETRPVVSADGRMVAFASNRDGKWAMYVAPLDRLPVADPVRVAGLDGSRLTPARGRRDWWASTGGLSMTFSQAERDVFKVPIDPAKGVSTGAPQRLTQDAPDNSGGIASPDGRHIAYYYRNGARAGIAVMDADGLNERPLIEQNGTLRLDWRAPGELLFWDFATAGGQKPSITVFNLKTGAQTPFAQVPGLYWTYVPARQEILHSNPGGGGARKGIVLKARSLADGTDRDVATIDYLIPMTSASHDGRHIAYSTTAEMDIASPRCELALLGIDGTKGKVLVPNQRPCAGAAAWSPDDRFMLLNTTEGPRVLNVETTQFWPLHPDTVYDQRNQAQARWDPTSWSPDGSFVLVTRSQSRTDRVVWEGVTNDAVARLRNGGRSPARR